MFIFFFTLSGRKKYSNGTDKYQLGSFHEIKGDWDPWCLSRKPSKAQHWQTSCCGRSYKTNWLTWQTEGPVSHEMSAISHCPSGAHIRSVGKQELSCLPWEWRNVNRHIRKSCRTQSINHRRCKASRPVFIYLSAWCLLPFFVTDWPREVTFDM